LIGAITAQLTLGKAHDGALQKLLGKDEGQPRR
jgi:hypothetical protein